MRAVLLDHHGDVSFITSLVWLPDVEQLMLTVLHNSGRSTSRTIHSDSWFYRMYLHHFQE